MVMARSSTMLRAFLLCCLAILVEPLSTLQKPQRLIVVGKIIIDEYGKNDRVVSIGGGGPQAALGAALALASNDDTPSTKKQQPVTFVAPVGEDWTDSDTAALDVLLGDAVESIELIQGSGMKTPRIQLWHDEEQVIQWRPLYESFGPSGADSLWDNRPSASDVLALLGTDQAFACHVISEGGVKGPGRGGDVKFLRDEMVRERVAFLGVESVAFADAATGKVSTEDAQSIVSRLDGLQPQLLSPDNDIYDAIDESFWNKHQVAVRKGPEGSVVATQGGTQQTAIPAARLQTGEPVNPTGAGNSYAGALSALCSHGVPLEEAACVASAVGAVFCEYEHMPPWTSDVIERVSEAAEDLKRQVV